MSTNSNDGNTYLTPLYGRQEFTSPVPRATIPEGPIAPDSAYQILKDELLLDGSPGLNLATFVNTWMDEWANKLAAENIDKNFIDHEEYPESNLAEKRSIWMMAKIYGTTFQYTEGGEPVTEDNPDTAKGYYGGATIGSSEAIMLGLVAHKYRWIQNNMKNLRLGLADAQDRPVVLVSAHAHTCFHKFCNYFGAVPLFIEIDAPPYTITAENVLDILNTLIDDTTSKYAASIRDALQYLNPQGSRTIGELVMAVGAIVATTFTGNADPVVDISNALDTYCNSPEGLKLGLDIPIHVDGASGGFVLPFSTNGKDIPFDFNSCSRVCSINTSNHKFGLTYPGMGSVYFRNGDIVDESLIYHISYLGGNFIDYTVNFSRGSNSILLQYYNLLRLGYSGYSDIINSCMENTLAFSNGIQSSSILGNLFEMISDFNHFPIAVFTWKGTSPQWSLVDLSEELRARGWIVPAYVLPKTSPEQILTPDEGTPVMRAVFNQKVSRDKADSLITDMEDIITEFGKKDNEVKNPYKLTKPQYHGSKC